MDLIGSANGDWHDRCTRVQRQYSRGTRARHEVFRDCALRENPHRGVLSQESQSVTDAPGVSGKGAQPAPERAQATRAKAVSSRCELHLTWHEVQQEVGIEIIEVIGRQYDR